MDLHHFDIDCDIDVSYYLNKLLIMLPPKGSTSMTDDHRHWVEDKYQLILLRILTQATFVSCMPSSKLLIGHSTHSQSRKCFLLKANHILTGIWKGFRDSWELCKLACIYTTKMAPSGAQPNIRSPKNERRCPRLTVTGLYMKISPSFSFRWRLRCL